MPSHFMQIHNLKWCDAMICMHHTLSYANAGKDRHLYASTSIFFLAYER
uniref:Uncharacterized protein n=1 Tax=Arundo donax TaxID=35708 RepID=A0A0A9CJ53_ARUDO